MSQAPRRRFWPFQTPGRRSRTSHERHTDVTCPRKAILDTSGPREGNRRRHSSPERQSEMIPPKQGSAERIGLHTEEELLNSCHGGFEILIQKKKARRRDDCVNNKKTFQVEGSSAPTHYILRVFAVSFIKRFKRKKKVHGRGNQKHEGNKRQLRSGNERFSVYGQLMNI